MLISTRVNNLNWILCLVLLGSLAFSELHQIDNTARFLDIQDTVVFELEDKAAPLPQAQALTSRNLTQPIFSEWLLTAAATAPWYKVVPRGPPTSLQIS